MAALRLEIAKDQAKESKALDQQSVEDYKELELLRLEGQRIATENLLANDQITKAPGLAARDPVRRAAAGHHAGVPAAPPGSCCQRTTWLAGKSSPAR